MPGTILIRQAGLRVLSSRPLTVANSEKYANRIAKEIERYISRPYPGAGRGRRNNFLNPPPGPPMRRSNDLMNSIRVRRKINKLGETEFFITAHAIHRGRQYAKILLERGYKFHPRF